MQLADLTPILDSRRRVTLPEIRQEVFEGYTGVLGAIQTITFGDRGPHFPSLPIDDEGHGYVVACAADVYRYAVDGIWEHYEDEVFLDLAVYCRFARTAAEFYVGGCVPVHCERLLGIAFLRARLDATLLGLQPISPILESDCDDFDPVEVAVLGQVEETSVLAAIRSGHITTSAVDGRVRIAAVDAVAWLQRAATFKVTVVKAVSL